MHWQLFPNGLNIGGTYYFIIPYDPVKPHDKRSSSSCPNYHQTPSGRNLKCMFCPFPLISLSPNLYHSLCDTPLTPCIFPCLRSHAEGGEKLFFPLWTASFPLSLNPLSPPVTPHGIQCLCHFVYSPLKFPDTSGRAHSAKRHAHVGQSHALEH